MARLPGEFYTKIHHAPDNDELLIAHVHSRDNRRSRGDELQAENGQLSEQLGTVE